MLIVCYACEGMYQGLHGINATEVLKVSDNLEEAVEAANEWGNEASEDLIYSYGLEDEYLDDEETDGDVTESIYYCDRSWQAYRIKEEYSNMSDRELDVIRHNNGFEDFVEEYCDIQIV